ncbi:GNAT family N-acetyltransferase [Streptomyces pinistramenti]|uniref:GNAT family N-acetyltransferase n=1 Tax=Streptomyces pinistramenti TaxID=2884812 RepID=UPI001D08D664|nr:GNAT family N-acetyltransferase [Streptomyces pinistramenti]MCB5912402.1 GNAT family N-acetyltransferase [Streptomyces pinistramenti]
MAGRGVGGRGAGGRGGAVRIRRATVRDAKRLTRMVRSSRAYEGPHAAMVAGYRVGPDYIEAHEVYVAVEEGGDASGAGEGMGERVVGFYALVLEPPELDLMFVADEAQGAGIGRLLIAHMRDVARNAGIASVRVVSHPPAEGFYRSVGARRTGTVAANPPAVMWDRPEMTIDVVE